VAKTKKIPILKKKGTNVMMDCKFWKVFPCFSNHAFTTSLPTFFLSQNFTSKQQKKKMEIYFSLNSKEIAKNLANLAKLLKLQQKQ
jgi:hypothetical protein